MIVRESALVIQNVVCVEEVIPHEDWFKPVLGLRRNLVNEDIYYTSPVIFKIEEDENNADYGKYTYYVGINSEVEEPEGAFFTFEELFMIGPAIYVRCSETEEINDAYALLEKYAEERDWKLNPTYYHVSFDLFDDVIIDIYAEIEEGDLESWS